MTISPASRILSWLGSLVMLLLFSSSTFAQPATTDTIGPKIEFLVKDIDWGTVLEGDSARTRFPFVNVGDRPVEIHTVKGGCSCTKPYWIKTAVQPGDSGWVSAAFGSYDKIGEQERTLTVIYNAHPPERVKLHGKVVERPIEHAPPPDPDGELKLNKKDSVASPWGGFGGFQ